MELKRSIKHMHGYDISQQFTPLHSTFKVSRKSVQKNLWLKGELNFTLKILVILFNFFLFVLVQNSPV